MKANYFKSAVGLLFVLLFSFSGCKHDVVTPETHASQQEPTQNDCDPSIVYYQNEIQPILTSNCAFSGCHDAGTATEGVILTSYERLMASDVIEAGNPNGSELYERITETDPNKRMPFFKDPLSTEQINKIRTWIQQGAKNTACNSANCDTSNVTFTGTIYPLVVNKCQGCHKGGSPGGGIQLTTYAQINAIAIDYRMLNAVLHAPGYKAMPLGGEKLPPCDIAAIRIWTNAGAPNN
jgi:mono/diheme cytochrome c family protein